ncbi:hypothetical protein PBI_CANTARE_125 [Brevibacterium phage Cantare]|uniref:Uncharacterized protein n=1 Tax=Brevibacterium phage Cantare TaxID=2338395 RepID=A0A3G3LZ40_9CAUD|nr:hypothetical protein PQD70_gp125 [Brevibacterium phage Cantare]AYQ99345.1 hypothetical protein PBI_CANTARE_125 [Brevibacterium phage Cantare]
MENVKVAYVENVEGDGMCGHCNRTNLKYVATMTDGSKVGLSCAKKLMGVTITPKDVKWASNYTVEATFIEYGQTYALWVSDKGQTRTTKNGLLVGIGGQRPVWEKRGWIETAN